MASTRRPLGPPRGVFDFSDMFLGDSRMEEIRNIRSLGQVTPGQNRILKRNQTMDEKYLMPKEEAMPGKGSRLGLRPPTVSSKTRANEALRKLAQIETKIQSRKQAPAALSDTESDSTKASERRLPKDTDSASDLSSQHPHRTFQKQACKPSPAKSDGQSGKGSRFLKKKKEPPTEARSPVPAVETGKRVPPPRQREPAGKLDAPDSDEEEMKVLLASLMDSSREKETHRNRQFTSTKVSRSDHGKLSSVLSLPSVARSSSKPSRRLDSPWTLNAGDTASLTSSPSITNDLSKSASSKMGCIKLASCPSRSEVGASEEPVSEATDDSLHDFRINILSIDDLVLADGEKSDVEQKEESSGREGMSGRSSPPTSPTALEGQRAPQHESSVFQGTGTVVADEEDLTTEVSEHLADSAAEAGPSHGVSSVRSVETPTALTASPAYSEDFEQSSDLSASEASPDRTLDTLSQFSSSRRTDLLPRQSLSRTKWGKGVTRVVKETAVQTLDPVFAYRWSEALTAYSPAVLALNDMLKQQLSLTQQFIEASRHLHVSLLQSLDGDSFHYHTLEETKEYIRCHRSAPLTMEAALQEVKEELQVPAGEA
uniref:RIKEN cDNA 1700030K09 gene n=1 Tax=Peromyscus maniculatus bairdii TaxID=230844 RepID=A0A8C8W2G0_PERMB